MAACCAGVEWLGATGAGPREIESGVRSGVSKVVRFRKYFVTCLMMTATLVKKVGSGSAASRLISKTFTLLKLVANFEMFK